MNQRLVLHITLAIVIIACSIGSNTSENSPTNQQAKLPSSVALTPIVLPTMEDLEPKNFPGLHNVVAYGSGYFSGSVPDGCIGFQSLAATGVKTIISVDGAIPDIENAKRLGLRYIHLPIGYNGFDEQRKLELVRASRDAMKEGPVYVHCHHGKHRSAAAAATVAVSLGWSTPGEMVQRMKVSGTSPSYKGLYGCAATASPLPQATIDALSGDFSEISKPVGFVKGMVEMDEVHDHLKLIDNAGWDVPENHPDLVPAAEAERMVELMRAMLADERTKKESSEFGKLMNEGYAQAQAMVVQLTTEPNRKVLSDLLQSLTKTCTDCHASFRD